MNSFADVITALGGYVQVAQLLGTTPGTVSSMQSRGSIPPGYWQLIAERARVLGKSEITIDTLARLYAEKARRPSGSSSETEGAAA